MKLRHGTVKAYKFGCRCGDCEQAKQAERDYQREWARKNKDRLNAAYNTRRAANLEESRKRDREKKRKQRLDPEVRERERAATRRYVAANRDRINEKKRAHYQANRETIRSKARESYDPELASLQNAAARKRNREDRIRRNREYYASKRDELLARRSEKNRTMAEVGRNSGRPWTDADDRIIAESDMTATELAALLGRSIKSITHRRNRLNRTKTVPHGSLSGYTSDGCRCPECTKAYRDYSRKYYAQNIEQRRAYHRQWQKRRRAARAT